MMRLMTVLLALTALVCVGCKGKKDDKKENPAIKAAEAEALDSLANLVKSSTTYFTSPRVAEKTGIRIAPQFVKTNDWSPEGKACDQKKKCFEFNSDPWVSIEWSALNFQMNDCHYGQYKVESSGTKATATTTLSARVDPDCDGKFTVFTVTLKADPNTKDWSNPNVIAGKIIKQ
jgi:hypothetical protein